MIIVIKPRPRRDAATCAKPPIACARVVVARTPHRIDRERKFERRWGNQLVTPQKETAS